MKKIICSTAIICLLLAAVFAKSSKAEKKAAKKKAKNKTAVEAPAEETATAETADTLAAAPVEGEAAVLASTAPDGTAAEKSEPESKDYTGWIKGSKKNITERFGKIQLKIKSGIGSYTIAVLNEKDKPIPVLNTANEYITNAFYLKTSKKTYNLVTDSTVRTAARQTTDGVIINYEVPAVAQVSAYFGTLASQKKKDAK